VKSFRHVLMLGVLWCGAVFGADKDIKAAAPPTAVPVVESEAAKKWKGLKAQEEWVARLQKQIQGETNQLAEMRKSLAEAFKLDPKKIEQGLYELDEKTGAFVEKEK
jgi:hypothetical protein